jgi:hypothetical protein
MWILENQNSKKGIPSTFQDIISFESASEKDPAVLEEFTQTLFAIRCFDEALIYLNFCNVSSLNWAYSGKISIV